MEIQETGPQSPTYLGLQQKFVEYHINDKLQFNVHKPDEISDEFKNAAKDAGCSGELEDSAMVICIDFTSENAGGGQQPAGDQNTNQQGQVSEADDGSGGSQPSGTEDLRTTIKNAVGKYFGVQDTNAIVINDINMPDGTKAGFISVKYATSNEQQQQN